MGGHRRPGDPLPPLLLDEYRTVLAARRQRQVRPDPAQAARALVDVVTGSMAAAIRRATDLGEVIALRGGITRPVPHGARFHRRDLAALLVVIAASVVPSLVA